MKELQGFQKNVRNEENNPVSRIFRVRARVKIVRSSSERCFDLLSVYLCVHSVRLAHDPINQILFLPEKTCLKISALFRLIRKKDVDIQIIEPHQQYVAKAVIKIPERRVCICVRILFVGREICNRCEIFYSRRADTVGNDRASFPSRIFKLL